MAMYALLFITNNPGYNLQKEVIKMAKIIHRYVNGKEINYNDLSNYQITNHTILDIIYAAINHNTVQITSSSKSNNKKS